MVELQFTGQINTSLQVGDIVYWNTFYFEINGVTEPQLIAGHQGYRHDLTATAHRIRKSSISIEEAPM